MTTFFGAANYFIQILARIGFDPPNGAFTPLAMGCERVAHDHGYRDSDAAFTDARALLGRMGPAARDAAFRLLGDVLDNCARPQTPHDSAADAAIENRTRDVLRVWSGFLTMLREFKPAIDRLDRRLTRKHTQNRSAFSSKPRRHGGTEKGTGLPKRENAEAPPTHHNHDLSSTQCLRDSVVNPPTDRACESSAAAVRQAKRMNTAAPGIDTPMPCDDLIAVFDTRLRAQFDRWRDAERPRPRRKQANFRRLSLDRAKVMCRRPVPKLNARAPRHPDSTSALLPRRARPPPDAR